ncbi:alpha-ketoglutarate-dependent dioxygenase AlkB family protein [Sphingobacterium corticis]|uniref:Alpha-ketoglutarate-dependent dioxygenase AlkB family protein n=1 Tax=Sphingobacterium corticis TaxID=1812823 RepID=A0ABW5NMF4_9SPHI
MGSSERIIEILPFDGSAEYYGLVWNKNESDILYEQLMQNIEWRHDEVVLFGKRIVTKRKVAWYGDETYPYTYSNATKYALPWTNELQQIKVRVEEATGERFNSCLLNLYHDGSEGMAWHSDSEKELKKHGAIASVSFGAERKFALKHKKNGEKVEIFLEHGSLLVMQGKTQTNWLHRIPPTKKIHQPRINLTFRSLVPK